MNKRGSYWLNLLKGLDYFVATLFGIPAGIYISSYVAYKHIDNGRFRWWFLEGCINALFRDSDHCEKSMYMNKEDIKYYYGN